MNDTVEALPSAPRWRPGAPTLICLAAGVMLTTAMPPVRGTAVLAPAALVLLFHQLRVAPRPGWLAFVFGVGHAATLMSWLFFLDPAKSIPSRALVPVQAAAAILFVAAHYWLFGLAVAALRRRLSSRMLLAVLPVLWVALELLRSAGELGFPWCLTGAAWLHTPLRSLYAAAGEAGVGAATALLAAAGVGLVGRWRRPDRDHGWRALLVAAALAWLLLWWGSTVRDPAVAPSQRTVPLDVACVQADVSQAVKWDPAHIDSTRIPYTELTAAAAAGGAELVVWAETAIPAYVRYDRALLDWVRTVARTNSVAILAGFPDARHEPAPDGSKEGRTLLKFNGAGLFSPQGTLVDTYAKHHLVPIGEAMPFQDVLPFLGEIDVGQAEWSAGPPPAPLDLTTPRGRVPMASVICFEAVFSDLVRDAVRRGAGVLVNITNDGWFGYSAGPRQHAALARIRGIECGVPLVRCSNNGISLIADAEGRVLDRLDLERRGHVAATIAPVARGTLYVRWGLWPLLGFLGLWVLASTVRDRLPRRSAR